MLMSALIVMIRILGIDGMSFPFRLYEVDSVWIWDGV